MAPAVATDLRRFVAIQRYTCAFAGQRLNPQHPRAIELDRVAAPFLLVAVLESMVPVRLLLVTELAD